MPPPTPQPTAAPDDSGAARWFAVHALPKQEHRAAGALRLIGGVEVFCPRIRFQRATRRGKVWFVEALFPGYVFARIRFDLHFRAVHHAHGVRGLVHFGQQFPDLPANVIDDLRVRFPEHETIEVHLDPQVGDTVRIAEGCFSGMDAVVRRLIPARERVQVLLDFLGRLSEVEVSLADLVIPQVHPLAA